MTTARRTSCDSGIWSAVCPDWEKWTGMQFPSSGTYTIPDGLTTLEIDRDAGTGKYVEPNIWLQHV